MHNSIGLAFRKTYDTLVKDIFKMILSENGLQNLKHRMVKTGRVMLSWDMVVVVGLVEKIKP